MKKPKITKIIMVKNEDQDYGEVARKVELLLGITTQRQLAATLDISQPSVASAKKRGVFPRGWIFRLAKKYELSIDAFFPDKDIVVGGQPPAQIIKTSDIKSLYERLLTEKDNIIELKNKEIAYLKNFHKIEGVEDGHPFPLDTCGKVEN